jgi:hypothetical protein
MMLLLLTLAGSIDAHHEVGTAADYSSQRYVLVREDTAHHLLTGADTLDYETEARTFWNFDLDVTGPKTTLDAGNELNFTTRSIRDRVNVEVTQAPVSWLQLRAADKTEVRKYHDAFPSLSDTAFRRSYLNTVSELTLTAGLDSSTSLEIGDLVELLRYERTDSMYADYLHNRLKVAARREFGLLSAAEIDYRWTRRLSADLPYGEHAAGFALDIYPNSGPHFELDNELSRRWYSSAAQSYWEDRPDISFDIDLTDDVALSLADEACLTLYDSTSLAYVNLVENIMRFQAEIRHGIELTWRAGFEVGTSRSLPERTGDDYRETALLVGLDWSKIDRLWISLDDRLGSRRYLTADSLYGSNYTFNELSLIADWTILAGPVGALELDALASIAPEWHTDRADNSSFRVLSLELRYRF